MRKSYSDIFIIIIWLFPGAILRASREAIFAALLFRLRAYLSARKLCLQIGVELQPPRPTNPPPKSGQLLRIAPCAKAKL